MRTDSRFPKGHFGGSAAVSQEVRALLCIGQPGPTGQRLRHLGSGAGWKGSKGFCFCFGLFVSLSEFPFSDFSHLAGLIHSGREWLVLKGSKKEPF